MEEGKYIHYCWFGGKPLPKLARKCLASWKKYLPDYEVICWSEKNCNFNECEFIRKAYEQKYYAFVADYIRTKVICEMGGIYFDTDMEVIKDPKRLLAQNTTFLGVEDTGKVACGVWYEKYPNGYLAEELLKKYQNMKNVDFEKRTDFSIPLMITEILESCGFDYKRRGVQKLEHGITIYPRDYFYPYSYNRTNNLFTDNTCMIHYYDASWLPIKNRIENYLVRHYGRRRAIKIIKFYQKSYIVVRKSARVVLFPIAIKKAHGRRKSLITQLYLEQVKNTIDEVKKENDAPYIVLHNGGWFGVTSATKELFKHTVDCRELYRREDIKKVAEEIVKTRTRQVIFSAMSVGGPQLIKLIHKMSPNIKIKIFWHGSMSQVLDPYGWAMHREIMELCRRGYISIFATCKKSLYEFYRSQGINTTFITNKVKKNIIEDKNKKLDSKIKIGLYAASPSNWRKNMFTQIAAASLIKNAVLDIVPLGEAAEEFARSLGVKTTGVSGNIPRRDLIRRMSLNDVNLYVTFSECSPMLPLESLEVGVPCITGNNHHYFKNDELEKFLVVNQESNPIDIKNKIDLCIKNREAILEDYKRFREKNLEMGKEYVKEFLEV